MKNIIEKPSLNSLADALIEDIKLRSDFFTTFTIVFPNYISVAWFKAYWLKNHSEVLMNVECLTLKQGLNKLFKIFKDSMEVTNSSRCLLLSKVLANQDNKELLPLDIKNYIYNEDNSINSDKLIDLSILLADLFINYDDSLFIPHDEQKVIYDLLNKELENYNLNELAILSKNKENYIKRNRTFYFFNLSDLTDLEKSVIETYSEDNNVVIYQIKNEEEINKDNIVLKSAPSMMREVEILHSEICSLLKNKDVKYSDILVVAPNMGEYETIISRVFKQDNISFPNIPFSFHASIEKDNDVYVVLSILINIIKKGFFTRFDLYKLINVGLVKNNCALTKEEIENILKAVVATNTYRNRNNYDDWDYIKNRLLLAKLVQAGGNTYNGVFLENIGELTPFTSLGIEDDLIIKFIDIIDNLESIILLFRDQKTLNIESLDTFKLLLDKWLSIKDEDDIELNKEYLPLVKLMENIKYFNMANDVLPLSTLLNYLLSVSKIRKSKHGEPFTHGITFASFSEAYMISSKYLFVIGMGSNIFPANKIKNELDQRTVIKDTVKEDKIHLKSLVASSLNTYISYVDRNLKSDEELFLSPAVAEIFNKDELKNKTKSYSIDENRKWSELYTKKEYKNKDYFKGLLNPDKPNENKIPMLGASLPKKIKIYDIANFLVNPLKYKTHKLMGLYDNLEEMVQEEYEPFGVLPISKSAIIKAIIKDMLLVPSRVDDPDYYALRFKTLVVDHYLSLLNPAISNFYYFAIFENARNVAKHIMLQTNSNYEVITPNDVVVNEDDLYFVITSEKEVVRSIEGNVIKYFEIRGTRKFENYFKELNNFAFIYASSLMDIASFSKGEYQIIISFASGYEASYVVTPELARSTLISLYKAINDFSVNRYFNTNLLYMDITSLYELIKFEKKQDNYNVEWRLFDGLKDYGYSLENFTDEYQDMKKYMFQFILFKDYLDEKYALENKKEEK